MATNKLIKQAEHTCPYCHLCFHKTWKKNIVLLKYCNAQHGGSSEEGANDSEEKGEEDLSRARDESSLLLLASGAPFDNTLQLEGKGKKDNGEDVCEESGLESNDNGSVGSLHTFAPDENTNVSRKCEPCIPGHMRYL